MTMPLRMNISGPPSSSATPGTRSPANRTQKANSERPTVVNASRSGTRTNRARITTPKHMNEKPTAKGKARSMPNPASMRRTAIGSSPSPSAADRHPGFVSGSGRSRMARTMFRLETRQEEKATVTKVSTTPAP